MIFMNCPDGSGSIPFYEMDSEFAFSPFVEDTPPHCSDEDLTLPFPMESSSLDHMYNSLVDELITNRSSGFPLDSVDVDLLDNINDFNVDTQMWLPDVDLPDVENFFRDEELPSPVKRVSSAFNEFISQVEKEPAILPSREFHPNVPEAWDSLSPLMNWNILEDMKVHDDPLASDSELEGASSLAGDDRLLVYPDSPLSIDSNDVTPQVAAAASSFEYEEKPIVVDTEVPPHLERLDISDPMIKNWRSDSFPAPPAQRKARVNSRQTKKTRQTKQTKRKITEEKEEQPPAPIRLVFRDYTKHNDHDYCKTEPEVTAASPSPQGQNLSDIENEPILKRTTASRRKTRNRRANDQTGASNRRGSSAQKDHREMERRRRREMKTAFEALNAALPQESSRGGKKVTKAPSKATVLRNATEQIRELAALSPNIIACLNKELNYLCRTARGHCTKARRLC